MESPALRELQKDLLACITGPNASGGAGNRGRSSARGHGALDGDQRLGIYRTMYFTRLVEVLRDDYAAVAESLGDEAFDRTARRYLIRHPSERPTIQHVGERFPGFLETELADRPWLAEQARIARARLQIFSEVDSVPFSLEQLRRVPQQAWGSVRLEPIAALRLVERSWSDDGRANARVFRLWRQGFEIFQASMDGMEARAVQRVLRGAATIDDVAAVLQTSLPPEEAAAETAALLLRWLEDGILREP